MRKLLFHYFFILTAGPPINDKLHSTERLLYSIDRLIDSMVQQWIVFHLQQIDTF